MNEQKMPTAPGGVARIEVVKKPFMLPKPIPATTVGLKRNLRSGGWISITANLDLVALAADDDAYKLITDLIEILHRYPEIVAYDRKPP